MSRIAVGRIAAASRAIPPVFRDTPQFVPEPLAHRIGVRVLCKVETVNPIRSFKGRGAEWLLATLAKRPARLVTASAGNFGQGLAYAARARGWPVTVFASHGANPRKLAAMRVLGAEVRLAGRDFDEAKDAAREWAARRAGACFVEDGREQAVTEGAGTIALELLARGEAFEAVVVPVGNGALVAGMGAWIKAHRPSVRVVGVCASGAPSMALSWEAGRPVATDRARTAADGIAVRVPVPEAVEQLRAVVDEMLLVDERSIRRAMGLLAGDAGLIAEPAGAAGLAGVLVARERFAGTTVATVVCGANVRAR